VISRCRTRQRWTRRAGAVVGGGILVLAAAAASRSGSGSHFSVIQPSAAMEPTVLVQEQVIFSKRLVPQRGDVVSAHIGVAGSAHETISRVVALEGDTVECPARSDGRCEAIVVNGSPVPEPHLGGVLIDPFRPVTVPVHSVFLMGDNRTRASDSRVYGPVAVKEVAGVAVEILGKGDHRRPIPGAPAHPAPGGGVDPADSPPPANTASRG
jgi:signal peptidase I